MAKRDANSLANDIEKESRRGQRKGKNFLNDLPEEYKARSYVLWDFRRGRYDCMLPVGKSTRTLFDQNCQGLLMSNKDVYDWNSYFFTFRISVFRNLLQLHISERQDFGPALGSRRSYTIHQRVHFLCASET